MGVGVSPVFVFCISSVAFFISDTVFFEVVAARGFVAVDLAGRRVTSTGSE